MDILLAAILGAVVGSFANVIILRWHEDASLGGRSRCPHCQQSIRPRHLVPVLSWLWLRGRCASCQKKISLQYPLVETLSVLLAVIAAVRASPFGPEAAQFWFEFIISLGLVVPVVMDIRWKELPIEYIVGLGFFGFLFRLFLLPSVDPWSAGLFRALPLDLLALMGIVLFFGLQIYLSHGKWLGSGDVWFGGMMAAILGWPGVAVGIYLAYVIGGTVALGGLLLGIYKRGDRVPFAPALALGTLLAHWYGSYLLALFLPS